MFEPFHDPAHSRVTTDQTCCTLKPLLDQGQAALAPDLLLRIKKITLLKLVAGWRNLFNEVTTRKSDDIFASATKDGTYYDPVPKGAELLQATLNFEMSDSPGQHLVDIYPPHTLKFRNPLDASRILAFLTQRGFHTAQNLAVLLTLAACGFDPAAPDHPFDLDDDPSNELHLVVTLPPKTLCHSFFQN